ncbi:MAG TPA: dihydrodipicolinate synthase family protein [Methylomirabilota bacterium]|nr:dihydrodipicolinate synthase family protein [Methylomirabilota bacterium]
METIDQLRARLREGLVIPASPLALNTQRSFDERRQRALFRYYHAAGAGGIAVAVHTTQFALRKPEHNLLKPVLQMAAETFSACDFRENTRTVRIAGICGRTGPAATEAALARECDFDAGLLSLAAFGEDSDDQLIAHCQAIGGEIPIFGFYLQPAAGGRLLSRSFWRRFAEIENVVAIKIAPFNRYQTLDVIRAVAEAGRADDISLYTGNDDNIVIDLLTEFRVPEANIETVLPPFSATLSKKERHVEIREAPAEPVRIVGGLLGHWACWTRSAVELLGEIKRIRAKDSIPAEMLTRAAEVTDMNAAVFDAANGFAGCIPGIHEVLRRQGLLEGVWCLDPNETLSPGQAEEIDRVCRDYPHLIDDDFVREHLDEWQSQ